jgi:hypothetical protein
MVTKLNETYTLELRAGLTGWSVDLYSWLKDGSRADNQIFYSEEEGIARSFYMGYALGFGKGVE